MEGQGRRSDGDRRRFVTLRRRYPHVPDDEELDAMVATATPEMQASAMVYTGHVRRTDPMLIKKLLGVIVALMSSRLEQAVERRAVSQHGSAHGDDLCGLSDSSKA